MLAFTLVLPTRDRPKMAARLIESALATADDPLAIEFVVYLDDDERGAASLDCTGLPVRKVVGPRATMGEMTRRCIAAGRGRYIGLLNDDAVFRTSGWDSRMAQALAWFNDGVVLAWPEDGYYGKRLCTFPFFPRRMVDFEPALLSPDYRRHCIDSQFFDVFDRLASLGAERRAFLPEIVVEHMNFESAATADAHEDDKQYYRAGEEARQRAAVRLLERIREETRRMEEDGISIILRAEGATSDDERRWRAESVVEVLFARPEAPGRWTQALNAAAAAARGRYLVFADSRAIAAPGWLSALRDLAAPDALVGSCWRDARTGRIHQAGLALDPEKPTLPPQRLFRGASPFDTATAASRRPEALEAIGLMAPRDLFLALEGFSATPKGAESVDLCRRSRRSGSKILLAVDAVLDYHEAAVRVVDSEKGMLV